MKDHDFKAHGLFKEDLELLFRDALDIPDLSIERTLGGMSNINLLAQSEQAVLVLRIPPLIIEYSASHFEQEFRVLGEMAPKGLSPHPMLCGTLDDDNHTPFLAYHYEPGVVHSQLDSMSHDELWKLKTCLEQLQPLDVSGMPIYSTAIEYLHYLRARADSFLTGSESLSEKTRRAMASFDESHRSLEVILDEVNWSGSAMHGDLRPSNVIFQDDRVLLLDWSELCEGTAYYDVVYLLSEPMEPFLVDIPKSFASGDSAEMLRLRSLALFSCISWTLERLIRYELRQVAAMVSNEDSVQSMEAYVRIKTAQLSQILSRL
ncbi:MAG: phosphotransferase [Candidatus Thorarchaeota archaeon]|jgi:aminoglycoside phosphotransferase (APT) family kinase protein